MKIAASVLAVVLLVALAPQVVLGQSNVYRRPAPMVYQYRAPIVPPPVYISPALNQGSSPINDGHYRQTEIVNGLAQPIQAQPLPVQRYTGNNSAPGQSWVGGYYRKNGTYVKGHYKTKRNQTQYDNWSTRGNTNPHTGSHGYVYPRW